jgi:hypothetical protein
MIRYLGKNKNNEKALGSMREMIDFHLPVIPRGQGEIRRVSIAD